MNYFDGPHQCVLILYIISAHWGTVSMRIKHNNMSFVLRASLNVPYKNLL